MPRYPAMNETTHEQLSALMDGELARDEVRFLLRRLDGEPQLAQRWSRLQVRRAVCRHEPLSVTNGDAFAAAVWARLGGEQATAAAVPMQFRSRLLRWAGGGAIAASVAVLALLA